MRRIIILLLFFPINLFAAEGIELNFPVSVTIDKSHFFSSGIIITGVNGGEIEYGELNISLFGYYSSERPIKVEARYFNYEDEVPGEMIVGNIPIVWSWSHDLIIIDNLGVALIGNGELYFNNKKAKEPLIGLAKEVNSLDIGIKGKINGCFSESQSIKIKATIMLSVNL